MPMQIPFRDDNGGDIQLGELSKGQPLILAFGYYHCPNLCGLVHTTLLTALSDAQLVAGRDYALAVVSIDPAETPADAQSAKAADRAAFPLPGAGSWHYLTGSTAAIDAVTQAAGYEGHFDGALKQFVHPTGLVVVTPSGKISSYLL